MEKNIGESMQEKEPLSRDEVIKKLSAVREKYNVSHPNDLDEKIPEVNEALEQFYAYIAKRTEDEKNAPTKKAYYEMCFEDDTLELDAGFHDPGFIDHVLNDRFAQDMPQPDYAPGEDLSEIIKKFKDKIVALGGDPDSYR